MNEIYKFLLQSMTELAQLKAEFAELKASKIDQLMNSWIDNEKAMEILHIGKTKLMELRNSGKLPYSKIDKKIYYKVDDLSTLLENNYIAKTN